MNRLFEHFHGYDYQATWKESRETHLVEQICKKLKRGVPVSQIALELEEDETRIQAIVNIAEKHAPEYAVEEIIKEIITPI